jgi:multiple sugar transport system permease protein
MKTRLLLGSIYGILLLGSITMIYPFILMVSGSSKSAVDTKEFNVIPSFLLDDSALYRKHAEGLFNEQLNIYRSTYQRNVRSFEAVEPPCIVNEKLTREWEGFAADLARTGLGAVPGSYLYALSFMQTPQSKTIPKNLREFKSKLSAEYHDIDEMNNAMDTEFPDWNAFYVPHEYYITRKTRPSAQAFQLAFQKFKAERPFEDRVYLTVNGAYVNEYLCPLYGDKIEDYNSAHGTSHRSYGEIHIPPVAPLNNAPPKEIGDWESFVRHTLNSMWLTVDSSELENYRSFLRAKYLTLTNLNRSYETKYADFDEIPLPVPSPFGGIVTNDWESFVAGWRDPATGKTHSPALKNLKISSVDTAFSAHLKEKYRSIERLNREFGTSFASFDRISPPQCEFHYKRFIEKRTPIRLEFCSRNFRAVWDYLFSHGRGIINTIIYCVSAVLASVIFNPLAAYAMSRYRLRSSYKILLFLLLTMAFPPMVTTIPVFLTLRDAGLLNTFGALILPGLVNGFSIFILKGFFDSLPRELYESAELDGANEWVIFWHITMRLSTPVLAVIALGSFTGAYGNFMFALLICQDQKMWTMMVWLYQLQKVSGMGVMYASLIIAAIPTLLVFIFCQNIIMKGIVVPSEK